MANTLVASKSNTPELYAKLRDQVKSTLLSGQQRIEHEKVRTYWETGRLIKEHVLLQKDRADYGKEVITKLSQDLDVGDDLLYRCLRFARQFSNSAGWRNLSWSHLRVLSRIDDSGKRLQMTQQAFQREWTAEDLQREVKKINVLKKLTGSKNAKPPELLKPVRGSLYTYSLRLDPIIQSAEPALRVDLGFANYKEMSVKGFKAGDIVESVRGLSLAAKQTGTDPNGSYLLKKSLKTAADLFTFKAYIERVIDGDTLRVQVDLGFGIWTRQTLRLRGIDCPEMDTTEGKRAKKFVERELTNAIAPKNLDLSSSHSNLSSSRKRGSSSKEAPYIIITSTKSDKYDRYLADVFYACPREGVDLKFLNNDLLAARLAIRM